MNSLPVLRAAEQEGRLDGLTVVTTDLFPELVDWIRAGKVAATVYQRPLTQGRVALQALYQFLHHRRAPAVAPARRAVPGDAQQSRPVPRAAAGRSSKRFPAPHPRVARTRPSGAAPRSGARSTTTGAAAARRRGSPRGRSATIAMCATVYERGGSLNVIRAPAAGARAAAATTRFGSSNVLNAFRSGPVSVSQASTRVGVGSLPLEDQLALGVEIAVQHQHRSLPVLRVEGRRHVDERHLVVAREVRAQPRRRDRIGLATPPPDRAPGRFAYCSAHAYG